MSAVDIIAGLFAGEGAQDYLGEEVSVAVHMRQAGGLAEAAGAPDAQVAAALLHDVGHICGGTASGRELMAGTDNQHGETGAAWLAQWFGEDVTEPVRLHVAAKRYLCAVVPNYFSKLSAASVYTLSVQGGPMNAEETAEFETLPHAGGAVAVRRWDEAAKDSSATGPDFEHFRPLLASLIRRHSLTGSNGAAQASGLTGSNGAAQASGLTGSNGAAQASGPAGDGSRDSALTATELCTVKATALPR
jgi:gamma-butyrobetaine dioxygenase